MRKLTTVEKELCSHTEHYASLLAELNVIANIVYEWNDYFLEKEIDKVSDALGDLKNAIEDQENKERELIVKYREIVPHEVWEKE